MKHVVIPTFKYAKVDLTECKKRKHTSLFLSAYKSRVLLGMFKHYHLTFSWSALVIDETDLLDTTVRHSMHLPNTLSRVNQAYFSTVCG